MAENENTLLSENLFFLAGAFSRRLSGEADEAFATSGLSSSHALILMLVKQSPGIRPSELAEKLYLKPSTITRLVQKLERRGFVERSTEGRATSVVCTDEGTRQADEIEAKWQRLLDGKREELGERYVEVLSEMITNALETMESRSGQS